MSSDVVGFKKSQAEMRRTSYAGETSTGNLHPSNFGPSSTSEPKLFRKGTIGRAGARSKVHQQDGDDANDKTTEEPNRKLQRMKAQSKKTFKFRKTRRREANDPSPTVATIEGTIEEQSPPPPMATTMTQTCTTSTMPKTSSSLKPVSLTATVIRRAKQRRKSKNPVVEIVIDDDSISSTRTSSTVGYRDSFGDNDDGCFHLLERYDDSNAVLRLLQSRQRAARRESQSSASGVAGASGNDRSLGDMGREALLLEETDTILEMTDSGQDTETELSSNIIYEHQDENTLI